MRSMNGNDYRYHILIKLVNKQNGNNNLERVTTKKALKTKFKVSFHSQILHTIFNS